jgi:hypothetical protein
VSRGAAATITGNTVSGNRCNLPSPTCGADPVADAQSTGILFYNAGTVSASGNTISANDAGVVAFNDTTTGIGTVTLTGNTISNNVYENVFAESAALQFANNALSGSAYGVYLASVAGDVASTVVALSGCNAINGAGTAATNIVNSGTTTTATITGGTFATACAPPVAASPVPAPASTPLALLLEALALAGAALIARGRSRARRAISSRSARFD